jgi:hypothetical protein
MGWPDFWNMTDELYAVDPYSLEYVIPIRLGDVRGADIYLSAPPGAVEPGTPATMVVLRDLMPNGEWLTLSCIFSLAPAEDDGRKILGSKGIEDLCLPFFTSLTLRN